MYFGDIYFFTLLGEFKINNLPEQDLYLLCHEYSFIFEGSYCFYKKILKDGNHKLKKFHPLIYAVYINSLNLVKLFLDEDNNFKFANHTNHNKIQAFYQACKIGDESMVNILLNTGLYLTYDHSEKKLTNNVAFNGFLNAYKASKFNIMKYLITEHIFQCDKIDDKKVEIGFHCLLANIISKNLIEILECLLQHGLNPLLNLNHFEDSKHKTMIEVSAGLGKTEIIKLLVRYDNLRYVPDFIPKLSQITKSHVSK